MEEEDSPTTEYVESEALPPEISEDAPSAPEPPPQPTSRQLCKYVAQHNRQAVLLSFFSLVGAAVLWGGLYLGIYWFTLVAATLKWSFNTATLSLITRRNLVSPNFLLYFLIGAGSAMILAAILRKRIRLESLRERRHYLLWVVAELFMAVPNITFSIWGNLSAVCRLRRADVEPAWALLRRIEDAGGRLSMTSLPLEIQDEQALGRILFVLQIVGLVGIREKAEGWFLYLHDRNALILHTA